MQSLHIGPFNEEPQTIARMEAYLRERGYQTDFTGERLHHEIYMSDARKSRTREVEDRNPPPYQGEG